MPSRSSRPIAFAALAVALAAASSAAAQPATADERPLQLVVGEQLVLPANQVAKYSEGTPGVVDVRLSSDGSEFVLVGTSAGTTTLLLIQRDGTRIQYVITVAPRERQGGVQSRDNIRLDFYFVQLSSGDSHRVGVGWPGTIGGTASIRADRDLMSGGTSATASIAAEALPRIDLAHASGWARIRRQATVVVANDEKARFGSGGEVNVKVATGFAASIEKIPFGSEITVHPRFDRRSGRIEITLTADVSDLTESGETGLPGRTVSQLSTVVNLELGQQIVLAGLQAESHGRSRAGLPWLSQIPVIGLLFGTHGGRQEETENLIFIVPTVVEAIPSTKRDLVDEALEVYEEFSGDHDGRLERVGRQRQRRRRAR